jgi:hypothetical protein
MWGESEPPQLHHFTDDWMRNAVERGWITRTGETITFASRPPITYRLTSSTENYRIGERT